MNPLQWSSAKPRAAAALLSVLLVPTGMARADVSLLFPIFGVLNEMQTVRLNAVLTAPEDNQTCPVSLSFLDGDGQTIGDPADFELQGPTSVHTDFVGDPSLRPRTRLQLRAQVMYSQSDLYPSCQAGVLASVEIFDEATGVTQVVLTNPVMWIPPPPVEQGEVDFDILFLPPGWVTPGDCQATNVSPVHFDVFDQDGAVLADVTRACVAGERFRVTLNPGPYFLRAQGFQELPEGSALCYETSEPINIEAGQTLTLSIVAEPHPNGNANGCSYPAPPPPR